MNRAGQDNVDALAPDAASPPSETIVASESAYRRVTYSIAAAAGMGSFSVNFWAPFLPLYLLDIGATSEANAIFWVAVATTVQGVARLISGPIWGLLSDRVGRKMMFLRALYFATLTTLILGVVNEPWQVAIAFACQGLFSGFIPAAVALTSVSVPDSRMNASLSLVTGAQYLGNTIGPAVGALLAIAFGYRGAILISALMPAATATAVLFFVPTDRLPHDSSQPDEPKKALEPFKPTFQLWLAIFVFFIIFALTQLMRLVTPIALRDLAGGDAAGITGLTFTLGGLTSAVAVLFLAGRFFRQGKLRTALAVSAALTGAAHLLLAVSGTVPLYVFGFALISLLQAAMIPATNALIASNSSRARRGTAFGFAGSAQALAFMVGPMGAAAFAALSLDLGFVVLAGLFVALAALLWLALVEKPIDDEVRV